MYEVVFSSGGVEEGSEVARDKSAALRLMRSMERDGYDVRIREVPLGRWRSPCSPSTEG